MQGKGLQTKVFVTERSLQQCPSLGVEEKHGEMTKVLIYLFDMLIGLDVPVRSL